MTTTHDGSLPNLPLPNLSQLVSIDTWLVVIPQIIARIHTNNNTVRLLIHHLLVKVGRHHPQVCVCGGVLQ